MKTFASVALALAAVGLVAADDSDVTQLKQDTFEPFIKENDLVLAEFFAPWCGHCKALAPEYEEAATSLKDKDIKLIKVDCTEEASLCQSYGVEGYPTLKVFRGLDNITPYAGQRKAPSIISYMTKQSLPSVSTVTSDSLEEFKSADKVVLVGYFDAKDTKSNESFTSVANSMRDSYLFGATNDVDLAKSEGVKQPAIVLYKQFDDGKDVFQATFTEDGIMKFAKAASMPLVGEVGPETYADYMGSGLPLAYIFAEEASERESLASALKPIAIKHKGKINLATIDAKQFGGHAANLNLEQGAWPALAIQDFEKNTKYPMEKGTKLTEKAVGKFIGSYLDGKLSPSIKSEPTPEKQEGPVTVVVANTYESLVVDNDKDVLLEFYAPWCGHCKALAPKYEELATLFSSHSSAVTIAKIDATVNDVPDEIAGFPTIKLFPAGKKSAPVDYKGSRTIEDLAEFVRDNGSKGVDVLAEAVEEKLGKETQASSDEMQHQAPAATADAGTAEKVKDTVGKVKEGVQKVVEAASGDDGASAEDHDEL